MKKTTFFSAVLTLFLLVPASITWAQTISSQKGLTTVLFNLKEGTIKVYMPDDMRPGDIISGSIVAEPVGKHAKQLEKNLAELKQYAVAIYNNKFPIDNAGKPLQISIPQGKPVPCRVALITSRGFAAQEITVPSIPEKEPSAATVNCNMATHALAAAPLRINGAFDGDASNTRCNLDGKPVQVLAESPRQCIVYFPMVAIGTHVLSNQEAGKTACIKNVSAVDMEINAGKMNLLKGEKTFVDVKITGLQGLPDTARLTVTNTSANIITMTGGNKSTVSIPPQTNGSNGSYTGHYTVQSISNGTFALNLNLDLPETTTFNNANPQPLYYMNAWLPLSDGILTASYDEQTDEAKINGGEHVYVSGNAMRIFLNGIFLREYDLANSGDRTVQDLLNEYSNADYPAPFTSCDSFSYYCKKNAALSVSWEDYYSVYKGNAISGNVKGAPLEKTSQNSLLITHGWVLNCCTGEFQLKMLFQAMQGDGGPGSYNVIFTKIIDPGKICKVECPVCAQKCEDEKKAMEKALEEARQRMDEIRKKEQRNN